MALQFSSKYYENYELQFILYISILIKSNCDSRRKKFLKYLFQICHLLVIYNILISSTFIACCCCTETKSSTNFKSFIWNEWEKLCFCYACLNLIHNLSNVCVSCCLFYENMLYKLHNYVVLVHTFRKFNVRQCF